MRRGFAQVNGEIDSSARRGHVANTDARDLKEWSCSSTDTS